MPGIRITGNPRNSLTPEQQSSLGIGGTGGGPEAIQSAGWTGKFKSTYGYDPTDPRIDPGKAARDQAAFYATMQGVPKPPDPAQLDAHARAYWNASNPLMRVVLDLQAHLRRIDESNSRIAAAATTPARGGRAPASSRAPSMRNRPGPSMFESMLGESMETGVDQFAGLSSAQRHNLMSSPSYQAGSWRASAQSNMARLLNQTWTSGGGIDDVRRMMQAGGVLRSVGGMTPELESKLWSIQKVTGTGSSMVPSSGGNAVPALNDMDQQLHKLVDFAQKDHESISGSAGGSGEGGGFGGGMPYFYDRRPKRLGGPGEGPVIDGSAWGYDIPPWPPGPRSFHLYFSI